jgi:outer membrane protein OmpA-like peptidoglycan-associated protein
MKKLLFALTLLLSQWAMAQTVKLEGYVYESKNRGYLNQVRVVVLESKSGVVRAEAETNPEGFFSVDVASDMEYRVGATKQMFLPQSETVFVKANEKGFVKIEMNRKPGYLMDVTLAEKKASALAPTDGLMGVRFEVYNNTTQQEVLRNDSTNSTNVQFHMEQGNHYTYLVRKKGYFSKRIEAYVNVKGCILCIDGIDNVNPGVTDNLNGASGFQEGVLLANLELQPLKLNSAIQIKNIYYDLGSAALRPESKKELDKLAGALRDNPYINVELGSHTDARGDNASNMNLSQRRAESAVDYLAKVGKLNVSRMTAQGYGETKLINRCADGVVCSETEHQENRRTELKILSIDEAKIMEKSLVEIIREENMDKTLQQIQKSDVIEVKDGEAMPDDLKRYIEEQKQKEQGAKTPPVKTKSESPRVDFNKAQSTSSTSTSSSETKVMTTTAVLPTKTSKMATEKEVKTTPSAKKLQTLKTDYSGYMVEILSNPKPLSGNNEVFSRFDNITIEATKNAMIYYAGSFEKLMEVEDFFNNQVKNRYPKAQIVRFEKGKKIK